MKTLQHELTTAQNSADDLKQQLEFANSRHEEEQKASRVRADFDLQEVRNLAEQVLTSFTPSFHCLVYCTSS